MRLRQSTAVNLKLGPFVDETDGDTIESGLTISQADVLLSKNGGSLTAKNDATAGTHDAAGFYVIPLDTTDTNTLGKLMVVINEAGALPVWREYEIVTANAWDSDMSTDYKQVDVVQISGSTTAATRQALAAISVIDGVAETGTLSTTQMTTSLSEPTDDHYNGRVVFWTSGALDGQARTITDYTGATGLIAYDTTTDAPSNGDAFVIL